MAGHILAKHSQSDNLIRLEMAYRSPSHVINSPNSLSSTFLAIYVQAGVNECHLMCPSQCFKIPNLENSCETGAEVRQGDNVKLISCTQHICLLIRNSWFSFTPHRSWIIHRPKRVCLKYHFQVGIHGGVLPLKVN